MLLLLWFLPLSVHIISVVFLQCLSSIAHISLSVCTLAQTLCEMCIRDRCLSARSPRHVSSTVWSISCGPLVLPIGISMGKSYNNAFDAEPDQIDCNHISLPKLFLFSVFFHRVKLNRSVQNPQLRAYTADIWNPPAALLHHIHIRTPCRHTLSCPRFAVSAWHASDNRDTLSLIHIL